MWRPTLVALLLLAGCAEGAGPAASLPEGWTRHRDARHGLSVSFPSAWRLASRSLTPALVNPVELLSLATFRLDRPARGRCTHLPSGALARMGERDVFFTLQESPGAPRGFPPRPHPFSLAGGARSEASRCVAGGAARFVDHWLSFRDRARSFYVLAALGRRAPAARRRELLAVLDSLRVDRHPGEQRLDADESLPQEHNATTLTLPDRGWRLHPRALTAAVAARDQLAFGSFPLPSPRRDPNCAPSAALNALPRDGAFVFAFEYRDLNRRQSARFPPRPRRFRLGPARPYECFGPSHLLRWREAGRAFQAHVTLGPAAGARRRGEVLAILDGLRVQRRR